MAEGRTDDSFIEGSDGGQHAASELGVVGDVVVEKLD